MNWYKSFEKKAQHHNVEVYINPQQPAVTNPYGNAYVDPIHVPNDPYHKQKEKVVKRKYDYFLGERSRINKRTAVNAVNRLAKAINELVKAKRTLKDAIESDEYGSLSRLIKSIAVKNQNDDTRKKLLLAALADIEKSRETINDDIESMLPKNYSKISGYVEDWINKDNLTTLSREYFGVGDEIKERGKLHRDYYVHLK